MPPQHPSSGDDSPGPAPVEGSASISSRLPRSRRGYDVAATDALLTELSGRRAQVEQECARLRDEVARLEGDADRHRLQEDLVGKTLLAAMSFAMKTREAARREAELILRNAGAKAVQDRAALEILARDREASERELLRLQQLTQEMQSGLATFLKTTLHELRPDEQPEGETGDAPSATRPMGFDETLADALEAALQPEKR